MNYEKNNRFTAWLSFAMGLILLVGWPIAIIINWSNIVNSDARLGYLICDIVLVMPLCFASWSGMKKKKLSGSLLFLITAGALLYDGVHFMIFLIKIKFLGISIPVYVLLIVFMVVVLYILARNQIKFILSTYQQP